MEVFVPQQALQGEDVPSFSLWHVPRISRIEVLVPDALELDEIYNTTLEFCTWRGRKLVVGELESDGYLGLLFKSHRLERPVEDVTLEFSFFPEEGPSLEERRNLRLFRPSLNLKHRPLRIEINAKGLVKPRIQIANEAIGTVIAQVGVQAGSEVSIKEPEFMSQFKKYFEEDTRAGLTELSGEHAEKKELLDLIPDLLFGRVNLDDSAEVKRLKKAVDDFLEASYADPAFDRAVGEVIANAWLKNVHLFNLLYQLAQYLHSIGKKKIIMINPLDVLDLERGDRELRMKIWYTDLTFVDLSSIDVVTKVSAKGSGPVPIYKLLEWVD